MMGERMAVAARRTQEEICARLEALDGSRLTETVWTEGDTVYVDRILEGGPVLEKVSVNFAIVRGVLSAGLARAALGGQEDGPEGRFYATGVSLIIHPRNPMVPSAHANYRYFETGSRWWFGGGADLTPYYLFEEDVAHFHRVHREVCDAWDPAFYPAFKKACDDYFLLPHRREHRGTGGIFFDGLNDRAAEDLFHFSEACMAAFIPAYEPILERRLKMPYGRDQRRWQSLRRGRYAEFNLLCDRGIRFGLESGGRPESILMALPPQARWTHALPAPPGTPEALLLDILRHPRDWA